MRTFHNLKLINDIVKKPHMTIGQRNYNLFRNYIFPFSYYTEAKYDSKIKSKLEKIPSIEKFVAKEFGERHTKTVMFDYYLDWIAEDEREKFALCIDRIYKYESTFPLSESEYIFELRDISNNLDLRNNLKHMLVRPNAYGINNFSGLRAFLDGYFRFKQENSLDISIYEKRLIKIINKWKSKTNPNIHSDTWDREFRKQKMGTTDFTDMFMWELGRFEEILKDAIKIELIDPYKNSK